jgi:hypothetical protein
LTNWRAKLKKERGIMENSIRLSIFVAIVMIPLSASTSMFDMIVLPTADTIQAAYNDDIKTLNVKKQSAEKFKKTLLKVLTDLKPTYENFELQFKSWVDEDNAGIVIKVPLLETQEVKIQHRLLQAQKVALESIVKQLDTVTKGNFLEFDKLQAQRSNLNQITVRLLDYVDRILTAIQPQVDFVNR